MVRTWSGSRISCYRHHEPEKKEFQTLKKNSSRIPASWMVSGHCGMILDHGGVVCDLSGMQRTYHRCRERPFNPKRDSYKFSDLRKFRSQNHFPTIWPGRRCSATGVSLMPARDSKRSQLSSWPRRVTQTTPLWSRIIPQCLETIQETGIGLEFILGVWNFIFAVP